MARLSLYLPPFAGDYSGVCSTLFGLRCLVVIVDANCCTRNYVEYDEPRWARQRKTAFSAQLRTLEAVMGDDSRIIDQACEAACELAPSCTAIIGSPVPAIMGMDLDGMAREIEARTGIPSLGLETTGFETCERGVSMALEALVRRFCPPGAGALPAGEAGVLLASGDAVPGASHAAALEGAATCGAPAPSRRPRVNVLGLSPHDFASEADLGCVRAWLAQVGADVAFCPDGAYELDDVALAAGADASLVVAWSGLAAARWLREACGVPYAVGRPLCADDAAELLGAALAGAGERAGCADGGADECAGRASAATPVSPEPACASAPLPAEAPSPLLIVGEQVCANALRARVRRLFAAGGASRGVACPPIVVASLFAMDDALMERGDVRLAETGEAALQDFARDHPNLAWVGDPLLARIPELGARPHLALPHEALSSTLFERERAELAGEGLLRAFDAFVAGLPRLGVARSA